MRLIAWPKIFWLIIIARAYKALLALFISIILATGVYANSRILNIAFDSKGTSGSYFRFDPSYVAHEAVDGGIILMDWADVEPEKGKLNFGPADAAAEAWSRAGKKFVIAIRYLNEAPNGCNKPQRLPKWELKRVPYFCDAAFGNIIPNYFDPTFKADLLEYVKKIAVHFSESPYRNNLLYVRVGLGLGSESFYLTPCRKNKPCDFENSKARLQAWGFTPSAWELWQKEMLTSFKDMFSYSTVIYPVVNLDINEKTGEPVHRSVALWAVENGMGLGALGLSPNFGYGPAKIAALFMEVKRKYPGALLQLQTVRRVLDADEMSRDLDVAQKLGATVIEWYSEDLANDELTKVLR